MQSDKIVPSKRLRNWHRKHGGEMSLREVAREVASVGEPGHKAVARAWLQLKGVRL